MSSSTLLICLLSLVIVFMSTTNAISEQTIAQICSKSSTQSFCLNFLKSNPAVARADIKGVGKIVLDSAKSAASSTKSILPSLASKTADPTLKKRYSECATSYNDAIGSIDDALHALAANDGPSMNIYASAAMTYVGDCEDLFETRPKDPSDLPKRNSKLDNTLSIALAVGNMHWNANIVFSGANNV